MKLWLAKNSEIPIKLQITTQVRIAVAAGDLKAGDRLPSTREIARRFSVHPNTVSAAYRELAAAGDVVKRDGSGVFVAESKDRGDVLDRLIESVLMSAKAYGYSRQEVVGRIVLRSASDSTAGFALFEPNPDLAQIVLHEVSAATHLPVSVVDAEALSAAVERGLQLIALADEKPKIAEIVSDGSICTFLSVNSVALSMAGQIRPNREDIVAIVSAWDDFLTFARLFLIAAKVDADSIVIVSTKGNGWESKLRAASMIICDSVVGAQISPDSRVRVFPLLSPTSLDQLAMRTPRESVLPANTSIGTSV